MKDLDQPSRATLRKYGVRFGAYHIYVPNLLKPAARSLASLLWVLKQDNVDPAALSGVQHLASSGRTSFPIDKSLPRDAYRLLGYRQCGERAVRVDILERLADLIRPALAWRETSSGEKPSGAFDGRSFVVTQAMTSLTGSAGEDFASILRALGYRMERRPPLPPKPAPAETATETPAAEEATPAPSDASAEAAALTETPAEPASETVAQPISGDPEPSAAVQAEEPLAAAAIEDAPAEVAEVAADTPPAEATIPVATERASEPELASIAEAVPAESAAAIEAAAAATPETQAEPALVEVWRPGGRSDERRPRHERHRHRHRAKEGEAAAGAGEAAGGEKRERHRGHGRRDRTKDFSKPREQAPAEGAPASAEATPASEQRQDQTHERRDRRERFEGKDRERDGERRRDKFGERRDKRERGDHERGGRDKRDRDKRDRESGPSHRQYATSANPRDRDRAIDPNSPFAKLAALKEQLAANRKD